MLDIPTAKVDAILASEPSATVLQRLCDLMQAEVPRYDWFGFYIVVPGTDELVLGPFAGADTDHVRIRFGQGICGQAAERKESFVVDDVNAQSNYLACSIHVKSEIVVPVFRDGEVIAEIDIDSHSVAAFGDEDRAYLEGLAKRLVPFIPDIPADAT